MIYTWNYLGGKSVGCFHKQNGMDTVNFMHESEFLESMFTSVTTGSSDFFA